MPRFPGCEHLGTNKEKKSCGDSKMLQYIYKTLKYPIKAREKRIEGMAVVQFVIQKDGTIANLSIKRDPTYGCGNAAAWVVTRMNYMDEKWIPGESSDGDKLEVKYTLPVKFKLE